MPLLPSHLKYHDACFQCHRMGHIQMNCPIYQCPLCLHWAPGHTQMCCPLRRDSAPQPLPPLLPLLSAIPLSLDSLIQYLLQRPVDTLATKLHVSHLISTPAEDEVTILPRERQSIAMPEPSDEEYDGAAEANITGSPGGDYRDY